MMMDVSASYKIIVNALVLSFHHHLDPNRSQAMASSENIEACRRRGCGRVKNCRARKHRAS